MLSTYPRVIVKLKGMVEYSQHGKRIRLQRGVNSIEHVKYSENGNVATISLSAGLTASLYPHTSSSHVPITSLISKAVPTFLFSPLHRLPYILEAQHFHVACSNSITVTLPPTTSIAGLKRSGHTNHQHSRLNGSAALYLRWWLV